MDNKQILIQIRSGEFKNLKQLYKYFPVVKKWLKAHGCNATDAQDIYQEALLVFCNKCQDESFKLTASFDTYILSVSKYIYFNQKRKERRTEELDQIEIEASNDVEEMLEKEERLDYCFKALSKISKQCKEMLELFYLHKTSMVDLAKKFGFANEKVAKSQKYRCLSYAKQYALKLIN